MQRRIRIRMARTGPLAGLRASALAILLAAGITLPLSGGQEKFVRGQNIAPIFDGWEQNPDGSFNMVFGYLNRNYEEVVDVPIGPSNHLEPGGPDQGQPARFFP